MKRSKLLVFIFCLFFIKAYAGTFTIATHYEVCFTPSRPCTHLIVNVINQAKKTILVQAYSFTSKPIAQALVDAKQRGVDVRVILDKSQYRTHQYSSSTFFAHQNIPVWIDDEVAIAHNKVIVIDDEILVTGSFNYTRAAEKRNAENVLIIWSKELANQYRENWLQRLEVAKPLALYQLKNSYKKRNHYSKKSKNEIREMKKYLENFGFR